MLVPIRISLLLALFVSACSSIDRDGAKNLGLAGQSATRSLGIQVEATRTTLDVLNQWWAVHDALVCANVMVAVARTACLSNVTGSSAAIHPPMLDAARVRLGDVMSKRAQAIRELNKAYTAFVDLAEYDAAAETAKAIDAAFAGINDLSAAASGLAPGGATLPTIASSFGAAATGIGGLFAEQKQARLMLEASTELHKAINALIAALRAERDYAASASLLAQLQNERAALLDSAIDAGLVLPYDALGPVFQKAFPNLSLSYPQDTNSDVIKAAAHAAVKAESMQAQDAAIRSYDAALATLQAVAKEHASLEDGESLDIDQIQGAAEHLETILATLAKDRS